MGNPSSQKKIFRRRRPRVQLGAAPGTVLAVPGGARPEIEIMAYGPDGFHEQKLEDLQSIDDLRKNWPIVWVHIQGLGDADVIKRLGELFSLHALALEDVINRNQRPKIESYDDHLYIVAMSVDNAPGLDFGQVNLFVGEGFVLTLQEREFNWREHVRKRIRAGRTRIRKFGSDYLCYALLDSIVDHYFPVIEHYGEQLSVIEGEVISRASQEEIARIHGLNHSVSALRHAIAPLANVAKTFVFDDIPTISEDTRLYFRDLSDHITQLIELADADRDSARFLIDLSASILSTRMNEVMKVLTIIATIFIPLGFIAGLYGMNFNPEVSPYNLPELNWYLGYPFALLLMLATVVGLLFFFRSKKWL